MVALLCLRVPLWRRGVPIGSRTSLPEGCGMVCFELLVVSMEFSRIMREGLMSVSLSVLLKSE